MGSLLGSTKKQKQGTNKKNTTYVQQSFQDVQPEPQPPTKKIREVPQIMQREKSQLTFKQGTPMNKKKAIEKSPMINTMIYQQEWIIEPEIIEHLRIVNAFRYIQISPALALHIKLAKQNEKFICNQKALEKGLGVIEKEKEDQVGVEYAIIYAHLFAIKFENLKKIKLKGNPREHSQALTSLEPVSKIQTLFLQQFSADDHPITSIRFLRRCYWPFLSKLSLRNNSIVDSTQTGNILTSLTNSCHIESIDISGQFSPIWSDITWLIKLGFVDAQQQSKMLEQNDNYYIRYNNRHLLRVDCSVVKNHLINTHLQMVRKKFNNHYFQNPIVLW